MNAPTRPAGSRVLVLLVGWTLFLFAHSYVWTVVPLVCGIALFAFLQRPDLQFRSRRSTSFFDSALIVSLFAIALQLVPLPGGLRGQVAPAAVVYGRAMRLGGDAGSARPLSIDPAATALALVVVAAIAVLFWCLRGMFHRGGVRAAIGAIVWIGLFLSPLAIVQHVMPVPILDIVWTSPAIGVRPYGPFVNRNDFAGWLIMALPLTFGYALARMQSRRRPGEPFEAEVPFDSKSVWLAMAICLMLGGLLASASRSGLLGAFAGLLFFTWCARRRVTATRALWALAALAAMLAVAAVFADVNVLTNRLGNSLTEGFAGRVSIWRQTVPVVRDFWPLGSGIGTYQTVMIPYQTMSRFFYISHADNELLQILAEGGLLVGLPIVVALFSGIRLVMKRLREDRTAIYWLRVGAAAGMLALAAQNMVEMTVRVPANAVLFAILAAVAAHDGQ